MSRRPRSLWLSPAVIAATLLTIVLTCVGAGLGIWQLSAWDKEREQATTDRTSMVAVPLDEAMGPDEVFPGDAVGRPVTLAGTWVPDSTVLVADRVRESDGAEGWWVATAVEADNGTGAALYVVRQFVTDPDQAEVEPSGPVQAEVWLQAAEGSTVLDPDTADDQIPTMRTADLIHHVPEGLDLYSGYGVVDPDLLADLPEVSVWTGARNFFYAFEWWVFGGFVIFMWSRFVKELREDREAELEASYAASVAAPVHTPDDGLADDPAAASSTGAAAQVTRTAAAVDRPEGANHLAGRLNDVRGVLARYRVMANIVGVLLVVLILIGVPMKYFSEDGTSAQELGSWITSNLGVAHGWLYMIFLFAAFHLMLRAKQPLGFSVVTLLCGTVPVLSFWAEHRTVKRVKAEFPEEFVPGYVETPAG